MPKSSAGILLYRRVTAGLKVFLVHPGGPFWAKKDLGVWSIPKGEFDPHEDPLAAAKREFYEETGVKVNGNFVHLTPQTLTSGKVIHAWALEGDFDPTQIKSNTFILFGKTYPEVDRGAWFSIADALLKIHPAQANFVHELANKLNLANG